MNFFRRRKLKQDSKVEPKVEPKVFHNDQPEVHVQPLLPVELWIQIISYIQRKEDLKQLISVSRTFRAIVEPQFYRQMRLKPNSTNLAKQLKAIKSLLEIPRIKDQVSKLHIEFDHTLECRPYLITYPRAIGSRPGSCPCAKLDEHLGEIVACMPSLQSLSLHCKLVNYIDHPKHTWLANVQAKNLQELELVCYNAREWSEVDLRFLHSPGMRNLKALKMNGMRISSMEMISVIWQLMDEPSRMIDTFAYDGSTIANWIVRNRNIKNLVSLKDDFPASLDNSNLTQALSQRTGTQLELLYAQDINTWLSKQDRSPYLNLSSVGTISIVTTDPKVVLNRAAPLMFLKRLKLIEFSLDPKLKLLDPSWSDDILPHLEAKHPSLVQVYCLVRDLPDPNEYYPPLVVLWERLGGEWRGRKAPFLTYWQIATGASYASD